METKLNNTWQTEIKMCQKGKNIIMPQGWACSDRTCKHNKNSNEMTNSKHVFGIVYAVHAQPNILLNNFVCRSENYSELDLLSRQLNDLIIKKDAIIGTSQKAADNSNSISR